MTRKDGMRPLLLILAALMVGVGCPGTPHPPAGDTEVDRPDGDTTSGGVTWHSVISGAPGALLSIWESPGGELWSVGASKDSDGPMVLRRPAGASGWQRLTTGVTQHLWWVMGHGDDGPVWVSGDEGVVLEYSRETSHFTRVDTPVDGATLFGVWGAHADDVWFVGGTFPSGPGVILRRRFGVFEVVDPPAGVGTTEAFFKVWGAAGNDLYIIGDQGSLLHFDGAALTRTELANRPRLVTIHGSSAADIVAVGGRSNAVLLERGADQLWVDRSPVALAMLNGVFVAPGGRAVAAGMLGAVVERRGGTWFDLPYPDAFRDWHAARIDRRDDAWVAGGNLLVATALDAGTLLRFGPPRADDGDGTWTTVDASVPADPKSDASELPDVPDVPDVPDPPDAPDLPDLSHDSETSDSAEVEDEDTSDDGPNPPPHTQTQQGDYLVLIAEAEAPEFTPIVADSEREIVQGPQGGIHTEIVLRVTVPGAIPTNGKIAGALQAKAFIADQLIGFIDVPSYPFTELPGLLDTYQSDVIPIFFASNDAATYSDLVTRLEAHINYLGKTGTQEVSVLLVDHL